MATRFLMGDFAANDPRFRMSKPGQNVLANIDRQFLSFDSTWADTGVIYLRGQIAVNNAAGGYTQVTFPEQLPSIPFVFYFRQIDSNQQRQGSYWSDNVNYSPYHVRVTRDWMRFVLDSSYNPNTTYIAQYMVIRPT